MKKGLFIALLTAFAFAVGFLANEWMERRRPLPPPPGPFGVEFGRTHFQGRGGDFRRDKPIDRRQLRAQIAQLQPQLDAFKARMTAIDAEFDRQLDAILSPEQRKARAEHLKQVRDGRTEEEKSTKPVSDDRVTFLLREEPARSVMWDVIVQFRLDLLTRLYALDDGQREKARTLLKERRARILELIDSSPPPSVMLSRIAPWVERIARPPPAPPPGPPPEPK